MARPRKQSTDVVPADDGVRPLTPQQRVAAMLEASGRTRHEVTEVLNVSEKTVSRWRTREDYIALIAEFQTRELESITNALATVKLQRLEAGMVAREALTRLLESSESSRAVIDAAALLLEGESSVLTLAEARDRASGPQAAAGAVVKVIISRDGGEATVVDHEVIDA